MFLLLRGHSLIFRGLLFCTQNYLFKIPPRLQVFAVKLPPKKGQLGSRWYVFASYLPMFFHSNFRPPLFRFVALVEVAKVLLEFGANPNDADSTSVKRFRGWLSVNFLVRKMWGKLGKPTRKLRIWFLPVGNLELCKSRWCSVFSNIFHVHPYLGKVSNLTKN